MDTTPLYGLRDPSSYPYPCLSLHFALHDIWLVEVPVKNRLVGCGPFTPKSRAIYFLELEGLSEEAGALYNESEMPAVNYIMASIWNSLSGEFPSASALRKFQVFIAFAYTYHYLNWFSKTSIIGWKNTLTKRSALLIGGIWLMAVSLYAYDYKTGFALLFFLSFLHVFLEFPLNWLTIKSIGNRLTTKSK